MMITSGIIIFSTTLFLLTYTSAFRVREQCCSISQTKQENSNNLSTANNYLAFNLLRQMENSKNSENIFFSPLSISMAFGMVFYGARGTTAEELRSTLGYKKANLPDELVHSLFSDWLTKMLSSKNSNEYDLRIANMILVQQNFHMLPQYKKEVQNLYKAPVLEADFQKDSRAIVGKINNWAYANTNGKINRIVNELDPSTVIILMNAVYFKGIWKTRFRPQNTVSETFYNGGVQSGAKKTPFMHMKNRHLYASAPDYQILELPYKGSNLSMTIILPHEMDGISAVEKNLTPESFKAIRSSMYSTKVDISLPKFRMEYSRNLREDLQRLGAISLFNSNADLSSMSVAKDIYVSQVLHKAVIEVNEEGSEAAAVTQVQIAVKSSLFRETVPVFKVNHPFLFIIADKNSDMILFMGSVKKL